MKTTFIMIDYEDFREKRILKVVFFLYSVNIFPKNILFITLLEKPSRVYTVLGGLRNCYIKYHRFFFCKIFNQNKSNTQIIACIARPLYPPLGYCTRRVYS